MTNQPNESGAGSKVNDYVGKPPRNAKPPKPRSVIDVNIKKLIKVGFFAPVIEIPIRPTKPPIPGGKEGKVTAIVVKWQKILVLSDDELNELPDGEDGKKTIQLNIQGRQEPDLEAKVIRVSECPNPEEEYSRLAKKTYMVLVEFNTIKPILVVDPVQRKDRKEQQQANNFVLNSEPPGSTPSRPVQDDSVTEKVRPSDFQIADQKDYERYANEGELVVAVVDSGVKFDLINSSENLSTLSEADHYEYPVQGTSKVGKFRLARGRVSCNIQPPAIGYCGITDYINYADLSDEVKKKKILDVLALNKYSPQQIVSSAFDDNRVFTKGGKPAGRHGTYVTTIINQHSPSSISVLPVKAFNCGGYGTLFDVLCCLNYVLAQKQAGVPIQVLNASWVGQVDEAGKALLDNKFRQFEQAGILVIAAAGNQKRDLGNADLGELYPACYSTKLSNVITVTCVERKYKAIKRTTRITGLRNELSPSDQQALLADWRLNSDQYEVFTDGYGVTQNYSNTTVSVGVYGGLVTQTGTVNPFGFTDPPLEGSSFAAARVSGAVASYLLEKRITLTGDNIVQYREEILKALTQEENTLKPFIQEGRLLQIRRDVKLTLADPD